MLKSVFKSALGERGLAAIRSRRLWLRDLSHVPAVRWHWARLRLSGVGRRPALGGPPAPQARGSGLTKKHVLFVTEKWCDANPEYGLSNNTHNFFGSLEAWGQATQSHFFFDEYTRRHGRRCDAALLERCLTSPPDLLFVTLMPFGPYNPRLETLRIIQRMGIPIVAWWGDTANPAVMQLADHVAPVARVSIAADSLTSYLGSKWASRFVTFNCPQDPRLFHDPGLVRDIDISFLGSVRAYPDRQEGIDALRAHRLPIYHAGGQREHPLSVEEYAQAYQRSKISLSFSMTGRWPQLKGHVFEATLCGAMLMDSENEQTRRCFEPMMDYVPFSGTADLVEKARYFLEHDAERVAIARRGHLKAIERYTGERFWDTVFGTVFGRSAVSAA